MKQFYKLVAWNLRMSILPILILWAALYGGVFLTQSMLNGHMYVYYESSLTVLVFFAVYGLVLCACVFPVWAAMAGKSKAIYTLYTLPVPRERLLLANITASILAAFATISAFLLLFIIYFAPFKALSLERSTRYAENMEGYEGIFLSFMRNRTARILFPTDIRGLMSILTVVICTTTLFCCIYAFKGFMRLFALFICMFAGVVSVFIFLLSGLYSQTAQTWLFAENRYGNISNYNYAFTGLCVALILIAALMLWRAINSVKNAKNI